MKFAPLAPNLDKQVSSALKTSNECSIISCKQNQIGTEIQ